MMTEKRAIFPRIPGVGCSYGDLTRLAATCRLPPYNVIMMEEIPLGGSGSHMAGWRGKGLWAGQMRS